MFLCWWVSHVSHINWVIQTFQLEPFRLFASNPLTWDPSSTGSWSTRRNSEAVAWSPISPRLGWRKVAAFCQRQKFQMLGNLSSWHPLFTTSWWVGADDARLVHDCPLLQLSGVGLEMWSLDIMHSWHLGPLQLLVSLAFNFCLDSGLWAPTSTGLDAAEKRKLSLFAIKAELFQFYRDQKKDPSWVGKIFRSFLVYSTATMFPNVLKHHVAQTSQYTSLDLPCFTAFVLRSGTWPSRCSGQPIVPASMRRQQNLTAWLSSCGTCWRKASHLLRKSCPMRKLGEGNFFWKLQRQPKNWINFFLARIELYPVHKVKRLWGLILGFLSFFSKAEGPLTSKCHFMFHLIQRSLYKGNPKKYSTYRDESFNGLIARIARSCHRRTWANVIHWKCQALHKKSHDYVLAGNTFKKI